MPNAIQDPLPWCLFITFICCITFHFPILGLEWHFSLPTALRGQVVSLGQQILTCPQLHRPYTVEKFSSRDFPYPQLQPLHHTLHCLHCKRRDLLGSQNRGIVKEFKQNSFQHHLGLMPINIQLQVSSFLLPCMTAPPPPLITNKPTNPFIHQKHAAWKPYST